MSPFQSLVPALSLLLASTIAAQAAPTRQVHGDTLVSPADPAATLIVNTAFPYAGGQVIDILKVAGAEQYFFIDAGPDHAIRRFYWIQFEYRSEQQPPLQLLRYQEPETGDAQPPRLRRRCPRGPELLH